MDKYEDIKRLRLQDNAEMKRKRALMRESLEERLYKKFGYEKTRLLNAAIRALMYEGD